MTKVWCEKCQKIVNIYPERDKKGDEILFWQGRCGCHFGVDELELVEIHQEIRYFLKDGTEIVRPKVPTTWQVVRKNGQ